MSRHQPRFLRRGRAVLMVVGLAIAAVSLAVLPRYRAALAWRMEVARVAVLDRWSGRADTVPTPSSRPLETPTVQAAATVAAVYEDRVEPGLPAATETAPPPTTVALPAQASLSGFRFEYQDINNCGPTTMAMLLSYWGWEGDQQDVAAVIKPVARDKNVRWDEMVYYVKTQAGWLAGWTRSSGWAARRNWPSVSLPPATR